jgi:nucleoid DNA-binding protein
MKRRMPDHTRKTLARQIAKDTDIPIDICQRVLSNAMERMRAALLDGETVHIMRVGTLCVGLTGRHTKPRRRKIIFRMTNFFKRDLNDGITDASN